MDGTAAERPETLQTRPRRGIGAPERTAPTEIFLVRHGEPSTRTAGLAIVLLDSNPSRTGTRRCRRKGGGRPIAPAASCFARTTGGRSAAGCTRRACERWRRPRECGSRRRIAAALRARPCGVRRRRQVAAHRQLRSFEYDAARACTAFSRRSRRWRTSGRRPLPPAGAALREVCGRGGERAAASARSGPLCDAQRGHQGPGRGAGVRGRIKTRYCCIARFAYDQNTDAAAAWTMLEAPTVELAAASRAATAA